MIDTGNPDAIASVLVMVVKLYGNREEVSKEMKAECLRLLRSKYQLLGAHEILLAYRLWAAGDLGEIKAAEMYGGQFNARQLAAILTGYVNQVRRKALKDYNDLEATKQKADKRIQANQRQKQHDKDFPKMIEAAKGKGYDMAMPHWYDMAIRLGLMQEPTKEVKLEYFASAKITYFDLMEGNKAFIQNPFKVLAEKAFRNKTEQSAIANLAKRMIVADTLLK